jgi:hypothetical protein
MNRDQVTTQKINSPKINPQRAYLKLLKLDKDQAKQAQLEARESNVYIFMPTNDLEVTAIAIAREGNAGWKGCLYNLSYVDHYLGNTCFIFATEPEKNQRQQWLLVNYHGHTKSKYWIVFGVKLLAEVYYAWAKAIRLPNPEFDPQKMKARFFE